MNPEFEIRLAVPEDAAALGRIHVESSIAAYRHLIPPEKVADMTLELFTERWHQRLRNAKPKNFVLSLTGEPIGFSTLGKCRDEGELPEVGEVYSIYLAPQSFRRGGGASLMNFALDQLCRDGYSTAKVWVLTANEPARAFYERMGFLLDGTRKEIRMYGVELEEVRYSRDLPQTDTCQLEGTK